MRRALRIGAGLGLALAILTCTDQSVTGPKRPGIAALNLSAWANATPGTPHVPVDSLEVILRRSADQSLARDTTFGFLPDTLRGDSAIVQFDVALSQTTEAFAITVRAFGAGSDWYHFTGSGQLTAGSTAVLALTGQYVGAGANAARVQMLPADTSAVGGTTFGLRAKVFDAAGNAIAGVPIGYRLSDTTRGKVAYPTPFSATLTAALSLRDSAWVVAETPTHLKDSTRVHLIPQPVQLVKVSGDNQTGVLNGALRAPFRVRIVDAFGTGSKGDSVYWSVSAGAGTLSATASATDTGGYAQVTLTPTALGTLTVQATAAAISTPIAGSPATFTAITGTRPLLYFGDTTVTTAIGLVYPLEYVYVANPVTGSPLVVTLQRGDSLSTSYVYGLSSTIDTILVGNTTSLAPFSVTGQSVGSALLIARAPGYVQATLNVVVGQPELASVTAIPLYLGGAPFTVPVYTADQTGAARFVASTIAVSATSTALAVAAPDSSALQIAAGSDYVDIGLQGFQKGSAAIIFASPGYKSATVQVSVDTATLVLSSGVVVPVGSSTTQMYVAIPYPTAAPVVAFPTSSDPTVLTVPATVTIPANSYIVYFNVTGVKAGTVTVSATAVGERPATPVSVTVQ